MKRKTTTHFEKQLNKLIDASKNKTSLKVEEILHILSGKGKSVLLIFLSLPFCQPIQIPGVAILFGILIAVLGLRISFTNKMLLPKKVLKSSISSKKIRAISEKTLSLMQKVKHLSYPRIEWVVKNEKIKILHGILIFLLGAFLALPLPIPLTNLIAGWPLLLIGIGLLQDDGLVIIISYIVSIAALFSFLLIIIKLKNLIWKST